MKLNLACGTKTPDDWINVDYAMGARFSKIPILRTLNKKIKFFNSVWGENIKIVNLTKVFPWESNSADVVYSSHTLEHFSKNDGLHFLEQCHRVLKPNGIINEPQDGKTQQGMVWAAQKNKKFKLIFRWVFFIMNQDILIIYKEINFTEITRIILLQ